MIILNNRVVQTIFIYMAYKVYELHSICILSGHCPICKTDWSLEVSTESLEAYHNGILAQNAFPYLTAAQRELIISGTCDTCFNDIFKDDDEPEENMPESYEYNYRD